MTKRLFPNGDISLCIHCNCMTYTLKDGRCGKCCKKKLYTCPNKCKGANGRHLGKKTYKFALFEGKLKVVEGECPDLRCAKKELAHYLMVYSQDLPKGIKLKVEKNWK